jgi:dihydroorotate dehydrogenase (NAD+) catalytic subunit
MTEPAFVNLKTELAPRNHQALRLRNPVLIAATYATRYGFEYADKAQAGAFVCKGTPLHPRTGNPEPRLFDVTAGMINAIGLENPGLRVIIEEYAPLWATWPMPVLVNIAGDTVDEFVAMGEQLEGVPGVAGIELNVSCPNVRKGGSVFGADAETVAEVTTAVRQVTNLPLIVKLSPNPGDLRPMALAAAASGADAVALINTITSLRIDTRTRRPVLGNGTGGLSGPAIMPIALRMVYEVAAVLRQSYPQVPVIGIGGISTANDALEFLMAGASAVEIGTINFTNSHAAAEIVAGIEAFLLKEGMATVAEIIGAAL